MAKNKIKKITRLYDNCADCGIPTIACICNQIETITTASKYLILTSFKESSRASSTGRLFQLMNPASTEIILWERTKPPEDLINQIDADTFLLFPAINEDLQKRVSSNKPKPNGNYIILDGTWNEAKKIITKSPYLDNIPIISLDVRSPSSYSLRRNGNVAGNLCTIESIMELLNVLGEERHAQTAARNLDLFMRAFYAGQSGHQLKG